MFTGEKKGEESHAKEKRSRREAEIPRRVRVRRKEEDGSTEMQQDQIRASRLFILVNTTPRIYPKS